MPCSIPRQARFVAACILLCTCLLLGKASAAGTFVTTALSAGTFRAIVTGTTGGSALTSVSFTIMPKPGSFTRPIHANFSRAFLESVGYFAENSATVFVPVFGLYPGSYNIVTLQIYFADGSSATTQVGLSTSSYVDPCPALNHPVMVQNRQATSDLQFDYFLLKDSCSQHSPAILDTDGNFRLVGTMNVDTDGPFPPATGNGSLASIFLNNSFYQSNNLSGINRQLIFNGAINVDEEDFSGNGVVQTGAHNIDYGRNGTMIVDVDTTTECEAGALEYNIYGQVLNQWNFGSIVATAIVNAGGDPAQFVHEGTNCNAGSYPSNDWFHLNSVAYNPADNTLIASSRNNFVMAVDYDKPADGSVRKIHWILGDPNGYWATIPGLRNYALQLAPGTVPPVGQHAVSIDSSGNLLLMNNGADTALQMSNVTSVNSYQIDLSAPEPGYVGTATAVYTYNPSPALYNPICGSAYDVGGTHLIDFADQETAGQIVDPENITHIQGLGPDNAIVFDLQFAAAVTPTACASGWNAMPVDLTNLGF